MRRKEFDKVQQICPAQQILRKCPKFDGNARRNNATNLTATLDHLLAYCKTDGPSCWNPFGTPMLRSGFHSLCRRGGNLKT